MRFALPSSVSPPRSRPVPLPEWQASQPRPPFAFGPKIGITWFRNETFVGSTAAPSIARMLAIVTVPALTGEVGMSSVTVAPAAWASDTTPGATSKKTTHPDVDVDVAFGAGSMFAPRKRGVAATAPAIAKLAAATPAFGMPASSTTRASNTPRAADGEIPKPVARVPRNASLTAGTFTPRRSSASTITASLNVGRWVVGAEARIWNAEFSGTPVIVKAAPCDVTVGTGDSPDVEMLAAPEIGIPVSKSTTVPSTVRDPPSGPSSPLSSENEHEVATNETSTQSSPRMQSSFPARFQWGPPAPRSQVFSPPGAGSRIFSLRAEPGASGAPRGAGSARATFRAVRCRLAAPALLALAAASAGTSRAEPRDLVGRPIVLARGEVEAHLVAELSLGASGLGRPISFAPDVWYGVAPRWMVGVVHSFQSLGLIRDGSSFCFRGVAPEGCDRIYNGSGVDVRWSWREGPLAVAPHGRFVVRDVDPWKPAVTAGALVRWTRGRFAIAGDPYLQLGLANRDRGNRAALVVPVWLALQPARRVLVALHSGWDGELATLRDGWHVPVALAASARAYRNLHVAVEGGFRSLAGPQLDVKRRALALSLAWRP